MAVAKQQVAPPFSLNFILFSSAPCRFQDSQLSSFHIREILSFPSGTNANLHWHSSGLGSPLLSASTFAAPGFLALATLLRYAIFLDPIAAQKVRFALVFCPSEQSQLANLRSHVSWNLSMELPQCSYLKSWAGRGGRKRRYSF